MRNPTENALHTNIARWLGRYHPDLCWFTIEQRGVGPWEGARRKARGVKPGVPDIEMIIDGRPVFVELKTAKGVLSSSQKAMHSALEAAGAFVYVIRSVEELDKLLETWHRPKRD